MNGHTVYAIIQGEKNKKLEAVRGHKRKLCILLPRRLRSPLHVCPFKHFAVITDEFNEYSGLQFSEQALRRYVCKLILNCYVSLQRTF